MRDDLFSNLRRNWSEGLAKDALEVGPECWLLCYPERERVDVLLRSHRTLLQIVLSTLQCEEVFAPVAHMRGCGFDRVARAVIAATARAAGCFMDAKLKCHVVVSF